MKLLLIYPKWAKLPGQTTFNLPPHGPVVFAADLPEYAQVNFVDENVEAIDFEEDCDLVAISMMLSTQVKRGWEIADKFRELGKKVIFGGIISGQDLGGSVSEFFGDSDYEYWYSFDVENTKLLFTKLSEQTPKLDVKELLSDNFSGLDGCSNLRNFCEKFGVKYDFSSYA